jgi:hypothetical protein
VVDILVARSSVLTLTRKIRDNGYGVRNGIYESHAYSVMRAVEIDGERLLLLKNPWGKGEWRGAWSKSATLDTPYAVDRMLNRL